MKYKRFSFADMRELAKQAQVDNSEFFIGHDFAMTMGINSAMRNLFVRHEPFIVEEGRLLLVRRGSAEVMLNLVGHTFEKDTLAYVGRGSVVQIKHMSDDLQACAMVVGDSVLDAPSGDGRVMALDGDASVFQMSLNADDAQLIEDMMAVVWRLVHRASFSRDALGAMLAAVASQVGWHRLQMAKMPSSPVRREREVFERFMALVNSHCREQRSVRFYADRMCMSEASLGAQVRRASGHTAKDWIDRAVATAAKVMLIHTTLSVGEIADKLHFDDNSFFCKYFRRITGVAPGEYRESFGKLSDNGKNE